MIGRLRLDGSAVYRIEIQGVLSPQWTAYLGELEVNVIRRQDPPITVLCGSLQDQAALLGVLNSLYNLGFPIINVACQSA